MKLHSQTYLLGIDEAGLGAVFGPLVVGAVVLEKRSLIELKKLGVKDSKLFGSTPLSREKRKEVLRKVSFLIKNSTYRIIPPEELEKKNMYELQTQAIANILEELNWKTAKTIYIAQLGQLKREKFLKKIENFKETLAFQELTKKVVYEKNADSKYLAVALASIIAKTIRDEEVLKLCKKLGKDYISGYPNQKTEEFLSAYFEKHKRLPPGIRRNRKWPPLEALIQKEREEKISQPIINKSVSQVTEGRGLEVSLGPGRRPKR